MTEPEGKVDVTTIGSRLPENTEALMEGKGCEEAMGKVMTNAESMEDGEGNEGGEATKDGECKKGSKENVGRRQECVEVHEERRNKYVGMAEYGKEDNKEKTHIKQGKEDWSGEMGEGNDVRREVMVEENDEREKEDDVEIFFALDRGKYDEGDEAGKESDSRSEDSAESEERKRKVVDMMGAVKEEEIVREGGEQDAEEVGAENSVTEEEDNEDEEEIGEENNLTEGDESEDGEEKVGEQDAEEVGAENSVTEEEDNEDGEEIGEENNLTEEDESEDGEEKVGEQDAEVQGAENSVTEEVQGAENSVTEEEDSEDGEEIGEENNLAEEDESEDGEEKVGEQDAEVVGAKHSVTEEEEGEDGEEIGEENNLTEEDESEDGEEKVGEQDAEVVGAENSVTEEEEDEDGEEIGEENNLTEEDESEDGEENTDESIEANMLEKRRLYGEESVEKVNEKGGKPRGSKGQESPRMLVTSAVQRPLRERKSRKRLVRVIDKERYNKFVIAKGRGIPLRDVGNVSYKLARKKPGELKLLHQILFGRRGKAVNFKTHILQFSGFSCNENGDKQRGKVQKRLENSLKDELLDICDLFDIPVSKSTTRKEDIVVKLLEFMEVPHAASDAIIVEKDEQSSQSGKRKRMFVETTSKNMAGMLAKVPKKKRIRREPTTAQTTKCSEETNEDNEEDNSRDIESCHPIEGKSYALSDSDGSENRAEETYEQEDGHLKNGSSTARTLLKTPSLKHHSRKKINVDSTTKKSSSIPDKKQRSTIEAKSGCGPSWEEMRKVTREILKRIDMRTGTVKDIVIELGSYFKMDLMPEKSAIKVMIVEELTRLAEEAVENEYGEDELVEGTTSKIFGQKFVKGPRKKRYMRGLTETKRKGTEEAEGNKKETDEDMKNGKRDLSRSSKHQSEERKDLQKKVFSRSKKKVDAPEGTSSSKPDRTDRSSGERPSKSKGAEASGPSNKELRTTICDILQAVDFHKTTFGDVVRRITHLYQTDLTLKMEIIESMIENELRRLKVDAKTEQVASKSSGKRPSTSKGAETSGPSDKELRARICDILQAVDFNTTTFEDVVKQITDSYQTDLTPKLGTIKSIIKNELRRLKVDAETEQVASKSSGKR